MGWAHFSDIGGLRPGSISPDATDIFQEGIIIPPTKLIDGWTHQQAALDDLLPQLALSRDLPRRHARADGVGGSRRAAHGRDRRPVRRRHRRRRARAAARAHRGAGPPPAARNLPGRHAPLHRRDRRRRPWQRPAADPLRADPHAGRPLHLRCERNRRPVARARQLPDEPRRAGHGARPLLPRRRPGAGLQCRRPAGARRGAAARGLAAAAALSGAARHARPDDDAGAGGAERAGQRRRHRGATQRIPPTSSCCSAAPRAGGRS